MSTQNAISPDPIQLHIQAMNSLARILGPTLAGELIVTVGYGWALTIDAISYGAVISSLRLMWRILGGSFFS